jgi:hypothetical protein
MNAGAISHELVSKVCSVARHLGCVMITADYVVLMPDELMVREALEKSVARRFIEDPVKTLTSLDQSEFRDRPDQPLTWKRKIDPDLD